MNKIQSMMEGALFLAATKMVSPRYAAYIADMAAREREVLHWRAAGFSEEEAEQFVRMGAPPAFAMVAGLSAADAMKIMETMSA